jgi:hypothetical protein
MADSADPLLEGPVTLAPGAWANTPDQLSASNPPPVPAPSA